MLITNHPENQVNCIRTFSLAATLEDAFACVRSVGPESPRLASATRYSRCAHTRP